MRDVTQAEYDAAVDGAVFEDCDFSGVRLERPISAKFTRCGFEWCKIGGWQGAAFEDCGFKNCWIDSGAILETPMSGCVVEDCIVENAAALLDSSLVMAKFGDGCMLRAGGSEFAASGRIAFV
jgi:hypothetical protein